MSGVELATHGESRSVPVYFPVSATKLIVLSICSFGLYELYWLYQQWRLERDRTREDVWPFWRAFFGLIFAFSLFSRIQRYGDETSVPVTYSPGWLAAAFVALNISWRLPDPLWLISLLTFLPLLPVRKAIAMINAAKAPRAEVNEKFSWANVALVIGGGLLLLLAVLGTVLPEEAT
jgi:hypothetical protein